MSADTETIRDRESLPSAGERWESPATGRIVIVDWTEIDPVGDTEVGYGWRTSTGVRKQASASLMSFLTTYKRIALPPAGPDEIWIAAFPEGGSWFAHVDREEAESHALANVHRNMMAVRYVRAETRDMGANDG